MTTRDPDTESYVLAVLALVGLIRSDLVELRSGSLALHCHTGSLRRVENKVRDLSRKIGREVDRSVDSECYSITLEPELFDTDGYPTEGALRKLREWPIRGVADCRAALEYARDLWHWPIKVWSDEETYEFVTGGWSGNEDVINAIRCNLALTARTWWLSNREGRHTYKISRG